jgi:hypothetical protein
MHRFPEIGDVVAGAALDVDQTGVTFGAVADHAIGTEPGKVDADRDAFADVSVFVIDQAFACVRRAQRFAVEQRIAAAEADLRLPAFPTEEFTVFGSAYIYPCMWPITGLQLGDNGHFFLSPQIKSARRLRMLAAH